MIFVGTFGAFFGKILASKGFAGSRILPLAANAFISSLTAFINPQKSLILLSLFRTILGSNYRCASSKRRDVTIRSERFCSSDETQRLLITLLLPFSSEKRELTNWIFRLSLYWSFHRNGYTGRWWRENFMRGILCRSLP
jgi:hypothetical protein